MTIEKPVRVRRRTIVRRRARDLAESLSAWRADRIAAAAKRAAEQAAEQAKARTQGRGSRSTGVGRVPAHLQGLHVTVEAHTKSKPRTSKDASRPGGNPITTEDRPAGNYATRRARGQRGNPRRPRRRELRVRYADNRLPDAPMALERTATRRERDRLRGRA